MSPKKTIEGAIGGIVGTILIFVIYGIIVNNFFNLYVNFIGLVILALLLEKKQAFIYDNAFPWISDSNGTPIHKGSPA